MPFYRLRLFLLLVAVCSIPVMDHLASRHEEPGLLALKFLLGLALMATVLFLYRLHSKP
jgi:hypothetical protein